MIVCYNGEKTTKNFNENEEYILLLVLEALCLTMFLGYKIQLYIGKHLHVLSYFVTGFGMAGGIWGVGEGGLSVLNTLTLDLIKVTELAHVSNVSQDHSAITLHYSIPLKS